MTFGELMQRTNRPMLEAGTYSAVIVGVYEVGVHHHEKFQPTTKIILSFDFPTVSDAEGKPLQLSRWLSVGRKEGCAFLNFISALEGRKCNAADISSIDPAIYLGRTYLTQVAVNKDSGKNDIINVIPLPAGMPSMQTDTPLRFYSVGDHGFVGAEWDGLPDWVRDAAKKSEEYAKYAPDELLDMPPTVSQAEAVAAPGGRNPI